MHCETCAENTQIVSKCHGLEKPKNLFKRLMSELDLLFDANQKLVLENTVLLSCFNMTHPISRLQAGQPTASTSYPEGGVLLVRPV